MALTYKTITEVLDFGPHITKIILETGRPLTGAKLDPAQFSVYVERTAKPGEEFTWPKFMGESLYVSDENGAPAEDGRCITLCMACSPLAGIGSVIQFDGNFNVFLDVHNVITQTAPIETADGAISGLVFDTDGGNRIVYAEWLAPVRIVRVDPLHLARVVDIALKMRREHYKLRAQAPGLPQRHPRLDPGPFRLLRLCQDYPVTLLLVPAHRYRLSPQLRMEQQLHARIAGVYIRM